MPTSTTSARHTDPRGPRARRSRGGGGGAWSDLEGRGARSLGLGAALLGDRRLAGPSERAGTGWLEEGRELGQRWPEHPGAGVAIDSSEKRLRLKGCP